MGLLTPKPIKINDVENPQKKELYELNEILLKNNQFRSNYFGFNSVTSCIL